MLIMKENIQTSSVYRETAIFGQFRLVGWRVVGMHLEVR